MEKKLLLLGILRDQEMHGYQLNEMLGQGSGIPIKLSKPNAYRLLNKMEQDGWVTYREEQEGNRPPRRVYTITDEGERVFQRMLRNSLATYSLPEFPGSVALNYLELLPAHEALALLQQRREKVVVHFNEVDAMPAELREKHAGIEYLFRFYRFEIEWLDEIIVQLSDS
jgi:DNA-binding PadR family transcriptional regulator